VQQARGARASARTGPDGAFTATGFVAGIPSVEAWGPAASQTAGNGNQESAVQHACGTVQAGQTGVVLRFGNQENAPTAPAPVTVGACTARESQSNTSSSRNRRADPNRQGRGDA
jgi:hypothetical protein